MTRKIWLITGVHSEHWIQNIIENYNRCKTDYTELVVVENGEGIGKWKKTDTLNEHVIPSEPGASNYINAGLEYVKSLCGPDDWFMKFDSDDYYGFDRVKQVNSLADAGAEACGAVSIFIKTESDQLFVLDAKIEPNEIISTADMPHGPTLAAKLAVTIPFPMPTEPWGEDAHWVKAMKESGIDFYELPIESFAYVRHNAGTHTFPVPEGLVRHIWFLDVYEVGDWNVDIVEGNSELPKDMKVIPHSSEGFMDAAEYLYDACKGKMNIHKMNEEHVAKLKELVAAKTNLEANIGAIQIMINEYTAEISRLTEEHKAVSNELSVTSEVVADSFDATTKLGRILLDKEIFIVGVPSNLSDEDLRQYVDTYLERAEAGKSSLK